MAKTNILKKHTAIPPLPFSRIVRRILHEKVDKKQKYRFTASGLDKLQLATEAYLVDLIADSLAIGKTCNRPASTLTKGRMSAMRAIGERYVQ